MKTGIIILAAGNSSRLGRPKQLLNYKGKTLLNIASEEAIKSSLKPIVVVLGAFAKEILKDHHRPEINYMINDHWKEGMSSSISAGVTTLLDLEPELEHVIIAVSDQPFISSGIFENLLKKKKLTGKHIVASSYAETVGTPTLFHKKYFDQLKSLTGNKGAKDILIHHPEDTETLVFERGFIDIDTETDYNNLIADK